MGFFDFLKKSSIPTKGHQAQIKSTASDVPKTPTQPKQSVSNREYDPWEQKVMPRNDNYAIAGFISYCQYGGKPIGKTNDDYPRYFSYRYHVNDPIKYHKKVIADGYLTEAEPIVLLDSLRVAQLKEILASHGLLDKGKRDALINRIAENIDIKTLNLDAVYVPTEIGFAHLKKYAYMFEIEKYNISIDDFENAKQYFHSSSTPHDIIWRILDAKRNSCNLAGDYGLARNELYNMAELLKSENKLTDALYHYLLVLYYDTSGCSNRYIEKIDDLSIAPGITKQIFDLKKYYSDQMPTKCYRHPLPHHYLEQANFTRLIHDIIDDNPIDIKKYVK